MLYVWKLVRSAVCLLACVPVGAAASSLGLGYSLGVDYRDVNIKARVDMDAEAIWQAYGIYDRADISIPGIETVVHQITFGADHIVSDTLDSSFELTYTHDMLNRITSVGPAAKLYYTVLAGDGALATPSGATEDQILQREIEEALSDGPRTTAAGSELFSLMAGLDVHSYNLPVGGESRTYTNPAGRTKTVEALSSELSVLQAFPTIGLDLSLWQGRIRPSVSGSYYLYSQDPNAMADRLYQVYPASAAISRVNLLVSGFLLSSWQAGVSVKLPDRMRLSLNYGRQLFVSPRVWADLYAVKLSKNFLDRLRADLGCSYSALEGVGQVLGNLSLTLKF
ncbi:MAG: hypothetical protein V4498_02660 [candidate division FCPU426 bacterium]